VARTVSEKQLDANAAAGNAKAADNALKGIVGAVQEIAEMSDKIATLTSLQENATGGITQAVTFVEGLSGQNAEEANTFSAMSLDLSVKAASLNAPVSGYKV